jgi:hypothetical protein
MESIPFAYMFVNAQLSPPASMNMIPPPKIEYLNLLDPSLFIIDISKELMHGVSFIQSTTSNYGELFYPK